MSNDLVIGMAGSGGDGIVSAGDAMITAAALDGYHAILTKSFGPQIRGGESSCRVRISTQPVLQLRRHARRRRGPQLGGLPEVRRRAAGRRAHDRRLRRGHGRAAGPPAARRRDAVGGDRGADRRDGEEDGRHRAGEELGRPRAARRLARGRPRVAARRPAEEVRARRAPRSCRATRTRSPPASQWAAEHPLREPRTLAPSEGAPAAGKLVVDGNEMCAAAAIFAGCDFFGGYPITPSSEIMQFFGREVWKYGGVMVQCEDEIAGHRRRRRRVLRRQEGDDRDLRPGHVAQDRDARPRLDRRAAARVRERAARRARRPGIPTKSEQSDLFQACFSAHGDVVRPVLAPVSVADTFGITVEAFNVAEHYQTPVILLSDQEIAQRKETVDPIDTVERSRSRAAPCRPRRELEKYERFKVTDSGISPISHPGLPGRQLPRLRHRAQRERRPHRERRDPRADERQAHPQARPAEAPPRPVRRRGRPRRAGGARGVGQRRGNRPARRSSWRAARASSAKLLVPKLLFPVAEEVYDDFFRACARGSSSSSRTRASSTGSCGCT